MMNAMTAANSGKTTRLASEPKQPAMPFTPQSVVVPFRHPSRDPRIGQQAIICTQDEWSDFVAGNAELADWSTATLDMGLVLALSELHTFPEALPGGNPQR